MINEMPDDDRTVIRPSSRPEPLPARGNELSTGTRLGEFEVLSVIGEGGFSIVYLVHDHSLDRQVALKEYMPSALASRNGQTAVSPKSQRHRDTFEAGLKSFINEAKLLARFDHPSLVKVFRFWEANGTAYMAMPLYKGTTLKEWLLARANPPTEVELLALLDPLTEALEVIHAEQCFHRDIAPDNIILLGDSGRPLLLDFGAARRVIGDMTQALTVILKPGYAPIEQYAESDGMKQGPWTDVYALAATLYYAIAGKTPPPSVNRLLQDQYVPLTCTTHRQFSDRFLSAIEKALTVRPQERTPSMQAFRADLGISPTAQEALPWSSGTRTTVHTQAASSPEPALATSNISTGLPASPLTIKRKVVWGVASSALIVAMSISGWRMVAGRHNGTSPPTPAPVNVLPPQEPPAGLSIASPPPAAGPVEAPNRTPTATFDAAIELDRVLTLQTPGWTVEAAAVKPRLRIGRDRLKFNVKSSSEGYVQVLVMGPDRSIVQLFPNSQSQSNRIRAGETMTLPQLTWPLETLPPSGTERFLVLVSKARRDYAALNPTREAWFLKLPDESALRPLAEATASSGHVFLGSAIGCNGLDCEQFGAARFDVEIINP